MNNLPSKFIVNNNSFKEIGFDDLVVGQQYYMEQIVIEFYCMIDYFLQVTEKTDSDVTIQIIYIRHHDNCRYPGDWVTSEGEYETFTKKEVDNRFTEKEIRICFYATSANETK